MDYSKSHDYKMPMPDGYKYIWALEQIINERGM